jgi:hypothetical protein
MPRDSTNKYVRWNFVGNANSSRARMLLIDEVAANGGAGAQGTLPSIREKK